MWSLLFLPLLFSCCLCQSDSVFGDYTVFAIELFASSDKNQDGIFTLADFEEVMEGYDIDGNGVTVRAEYVLTVQQANLDLDKFANVVFDIYDMCTHDNKVTLADKECYVLHLDSNEDKQITQDEWVAHWVKLLEDHENLHTGIGGL